jgi:hypothetical protein
MENESNGNEKLQTIYRWKALSEENILEQFISGFIHYESLTSEEKEIRYKVQLSDLKSDQANWWFIGLCVVPRFS